jgi:hypothetical protein
MAKFNLKRIDLHCPEYDTDATLRIDESEAPPVLRVQYEKGGHEGRPNFAAGIPTDWTDHDLAELISMRLKPRPGRNWPAWEMCARDYGGPMLFRWWKGEKP